jgi:polyphosphate kinase
MLIGSADLRRRNLDRRIEATVPVIDPELRGRLREVLELLLVDDMQAWTLGPDGCWSRVPTETAISTQRSLMAAALERAQRRREPDKLASAPRT